MKKVLIVMGTRPEVIKLAMVALELRKFPSEFDVQVLLTGQHRELADSMLGVFGIEAAHRLDIMKEAQTLTDVTVRVLQKLEPILVRENPDIVIVQGDTTTSFAAGLAAFYQKITVAHVEAGLRTYEKYYPFPEEINRRLLSAVTDIHYPPTDLAERALLEEGYDKKNIVVTGNTVIDALHYVIAKNDIEVTSEFEGKRQLLLTMHRRENFGQPMENVCDAVDSLLAQHSDISVLFPVHPNPNVQKIVQRRWKSEPRVKLSEPLGYLDFVRAMAQSFLVLSDSGGVQEEAPSLNKPVLVLRGETERREGVDGGVTTLVGTNKDTIVDTANTLLNNPDAYNKMGNLPNPYGDGLASQVIAKHLMSI